MNDPDYILATPRLRLEPLKEADVDELWPYVSNPEIPKLMAWAPHKDKQRTLEFVRSVEENFRAGRAISWGVRFEGKLVGVFSIISIVRSHHLLTFDKGELAYWIGPEYQGKGIMTEAGVKVLEFGFNQLKLHKIYVGFHAGNKGSQGLIERLKFRFSHKELEAFSKNNEWVDVFYYDMLEREYRELYK